MSNLIAEMHDEHFDPDSDLGMDLGTAAVRWNNIYAKILLIYESISAAAAAGLKIGLTTSQKLGFFGVTPIVQPISTTDLRQLLINLGFLASGGASPLDLNGGTLTTSGIASIGTLNLTIGTNLVFFDDELVSYNDEAVFS